MTKQLYPEIRALRQPATKLIVLLHGLGSNGDDLLALAPYMREELSNYHFLAPHGLEAYDMAPFGRQWFSLQDRTPRLVMELVAQNAPKLATLIHAKQFELGLTDQDTVIIGFSQGAMIGSYLTLLTPEPFAGFIGFSGRVIYPKRRSNSAATTPICLVHGEDDSVVPSEELQKAKQYLDQQNIACEAHLLDNLTHSIDARGVEIAIKFIKKHQISRGQADENI